MTWTARFHRHGVLDDHEWGTPEQAIVFLAGGEEEGTLVAHSIVGPDDVVLTEEQIGKVTYAYVMNGQLGQPDWRELLASMISSGPQDAP